jgi:Arc/MetJ family transcription regulator
MIFKDVRDGRPYPEHGLSMRDWARIPPRQIRMDELIATKRELRLDALLDEDSTFYGDLFGHAVRWQGQIYLEDGLHRALRAALQQRTVIHVRILNLDAAGAGADIEGGEPGQPLPGQATQGGQRPAAGGQQVNPSTATRSRRPAVAREG